MYDELSAYRRQDFQLGKWRVHQPSLGDVEEITSEELYWTMVCNFVGTAYDERLYLWAKGIDYNSMTDFHVFAMRVDEKVVLPVDLFFPDIHIEDFNSYIDPDTQDLILIDAKHNQVITEKDYTMLTDFLRNMHCLPKNSIKDGNEATKQWRLKYELDQLEKRIARGIMPEFHSILQPLISSMVNSEGFKYDWHTVWDLPINVFYDCLRRTQIIKMAQQLVQGLYSGCIDYKTMKNKEDLNWLRAIKDKT